MEPEQSKDSSDVAAEIMNGNFISEDIIKQEEMLEKAVINEELQLREKMLKETSEHKEQCFKRLQHLLNRSSIYAEYLAEKLQRQEDTSEKQKLNEQKRNKRKLLKEQKQEELRASNRVQKKTLTSSLNSLQPTKRKKGDEATSDELIATKPSKKQKNSNDIKISDFFKKEDLENQKIVELDEDISLATTDVKACTAEDIMERHPDLFTGGTMRSYQVEGYEWLKVLYENGVNGILADEMGLGKTIQCIAIIAHLVEMGVPGPFLVCAPLSTLNNWCSEFKRFAPQIPVLLFHGSKDERVDLAREIKKRTDVLGNAIQPVVITSYQMVILDEKKLAKLDWKYLIVDEAHRIKNFQCKLITSLKKYKALNRLLLTGTPLQNNMAELWSLLNFILPEIFDELKVFESWFDITEMSKSNVTAQILAQEREKKIVHTIHQILTPFLLRRTKADVTLDLPPKKEVVVHAPLTVLQHSYYTAVITRTIDKMLNPEKSRNVKEVLETKRKHNTVNYRDLENRYFIDEEFESEELQNCDLTKKDESYSAYHIDGLVINNIKMQNILMMLRKICAHPYLVSHPVDPVTQLYAIDEDLVKNSGKLLLLDVMLPELKKRGHKVLIFSQFVMMLEILADYCDFRNYKFNMLHGTMSLQEREIEIREFNETQSSFLFLISTRAGGLGLNLAAADTVIIYDSDWNPQCDLQAQDRCHRIGQTKPVVVYRLILENTVDQKIMERATVKRRLEKMIIQKGRFSTNDTLTKSQNAISTEELLELLQSSDEQGCIRLDKNILSPSELNAILDRSDMVTEQ